jgi:cleavage and polyadenylation specificity factor subunit 1
LHAIGGARGMWALSVRTPVHANGGSAYERTANADDDTIVVSTDHNPSPGVSRVRLRVLEPELCGLGAELAGCT